MEKKMTTVVTQIIKILKSSYCQFELQFINVISIDNLLTTWKECDNKSSISKEDQIIIIVCGTFILTVILVFNMTGPKTHHHHFLNVWIVQASFNENHIPHLKDPKCMGQLCKQKSIRNMFLSTVSTRSLKAQYF